MNWSLLVLDGNQRGQQFHVETAACTIGRDSTNVVTIQDEEVSRFHAEVKLENDQLTLHDLDSVNGTYVNQVAVKSCLIQSGDQIRLGKTYLQVVSLLESDSRMQVVSQQKDDSVRFVNEVGQGFDKNVVGTVQSNLQFLYNAAIATSRSVERKNLCVRLLNLVFEWIDADRGCILLRDEMDNRLVPVSVKYRDDQAREYKLSVSRQMVKHVAQNRKGILTHNAREDERWDKNDSFLDNAVVEAICVPIRGRTKMHGVIYVDTIATPQSDGKSARFSSDHLKLIVAIGDQAAIAIESEEHYSALVKSEKLTAVGQTLAALSHHVKNVLQSINGGNHLVEVGLAERDLELIQRGWDIVSGNQQRLSHLVMDMLNYGKARTPKRNSFNVVRMIEKAIAGVATLTDRNGISVTFVPPSNGPSFFGDESSLKTAVENVLLSAVPIKETLVSGIVEIEVERGSKQLTLTIRDNFQTLDPVEIEKLFRPFATENEYHVRGIGLAVARKIVEEHEGTVSAKNVEGGGLEIVFELPVVERKSSAATNPAGVIDSDDFLPE